MICIIMILVVDLVLKIFILEILILVFMIVDDREIFLLGVSCIIIRLVFLYVCYSFIYNYSVLWNYYYILVYF